MPCVFCCCSFHPSIHLPVLCGWWLCWPALLLPPRCRTLPACRDRHLWWTYSQQGSSPDVLLSGYQQVVDVTLPTTLVFIDNQQQALSLYAQLSNLGQILAYNSHWTVSPTKGSWQNVLNLIRPSKQLCYHWDRDTLILPGAGFFLRN